MIPFFYYLLKVIVCSGILFTYYLLALRNKRFHQWNRFYLILSVAFSLLIPLISISFFEVKTVETKTSFQLLNAVQSANDYIENIDIGKSGSVTADMWLGICYFSMCLFFLIPLLNTIFKIFRITRTYKINYYDGIKFLNTDVKGSPFSFLKYIIWNKQIDLHSETGKQIFRHELVHVNEKHSLDKLFLGIVLIFFWINPFFWLVRREISMVHEFIADEKSIEGQDAAALAAMILNAVHPSAFKSIANPFFQSTIKRRILMLTNNHNPKISYMSRIIALPVVLLTFMAFTIKSKQAVKTDLTTNKHITVVIDAGHGYIDGKQSGAISNSLKEDDITLSIAKYIKEINSNPQINIILTRSSRENIGLRERLEKAQEVHADLFLSIHVNAGFNGENGMEVVVSDRNINQREASRKLGSALVSEIQKEYLTKRELQVKQNGVYVLDKSPCPSALIECGYITNEKDRGFISDETNQKIVAGKILRAIELYLNSPNLIGNYVQPDLNKSANSLSVNSKDTTKPDPLLVIDGKVIGKFSVFKTDMDTDPQNIESMNVLTGKTATKKYGFKGKDGVIEIVSKDRNKPILIKKENRSTSENIDQNTKPNTVKVESENASGNLNQITEPIFTKEEIEAKIDKDIWIKYLEEHLQPIINELSKSIPSGKYSVMIQLLINKEGNVTNVKALNDPGYNISSKVVNMIVTSSPKWDPAMQNGKAVNSYHNQPITLVIGKS